MRAKEVIVTRLATDQLFSDPSFLIPYPLSFILHPLI